MHPISLLLLFCLFQDLTPLTPAEKRQLAYDRIAGLACPTLVSVQQWRIYRRLSKLDNLQLVLAVMPSERSPCCCPPPLTGMPGQTDARLSTPHSACILDCAVFLCMYIWSSLWPRSYLRRRTLAIAASRLFVFWLPYITELPAFDATVSAPSSVPLVGWAVDAFMVFVGGWLLLFACARLLLPLHPTPSSAPVVRSLLPATQVLRPSLCNPSLPSRQPPFLPCSQPHLPPVILLPGRPRALPGPPGCPGRELPHPRHPRHLLLRQPGGRHLPGEHVHVAVPGHGCISAKQHAVSLLCGLLPSAHSC